MAKNEIAGVWADGETDIYGYSPSELTTTDSNLYLASIYKFDRRFLTESLIIYTWLMIDMNLFAVIGVISIPMLTMIVMWV